MGTLLAWYDPAGAGSVRGDILGYEITGSLLQGRPGSFTLAPNVGSDMPPASLQWELAWTDGAKIYRRHCARNNNNQIQCGEAVVFAQSGVGMSHLSMVRIGNRYALAWREAGLRPDPVESLRPGLTSEYIHFQEWFSGPVTIWPDVWGGVSSPSLTFNSYSGVMSLFWQGGSAIRHAKRDTAWSAVETIVSGATPSISIGRNGASSNKEILLSRSLSGVPYAIQRNTLNYEPLREGFTEKGKRGNASIGVENEETVFEGRGGHILFRDGMMRIAVLSASINGEMLRYPALSDTLDVLRLRQIDSAATTLPHPGVGTLEITLLYRRSGVVPSAAQFRLELRDAASG